VEENEAVTSVVIDELVHATSCRNAWRPPVPCNSAQREKT
jgi:hypothetical protein